MLAGCDWWISIWSVDNMVWLTDILETFPRVFCFRKSRINENGDNLRIPSFIWRGAAHFVQINTVITLSASATLDDLRASCHTGRRQSFFGAKLEAWRHKMSHIFHFLQSDIVLGVENPFSWISNDISTEKLSFISTYLSNTLTNLFICQSIGQPSISIPFLLTYMDVRTVKFTHLLNTAVGQLPFARCRWEARK